VLAGYGVTLGFHRLLTHRSFQTFKPVEYVLVGLGSMAVQGPVMTWVADHRKHHAHTDKEGDPHSPHGHGGGLRGTLVDGLTGALWGGAVRIFLLHHVTGRSTRSAPSSARAGSPSDDHSTNVFWLSLLSFGESWHHNHHAFPRSAVHGLRWWEIDPTAWIVLAMKKTRLAWNVVEITPERQRQKLA
jgi:stearoyl-CoA desaturase (Delta-9 desaturase)